MDNNLGIYMFGKYLNLACQDLRQKRFNYLNFYLFFIAVTENKKVWLHQAEKHCQQTCLHPQLGLKKNNVENVFQCQLKLLYVMHCQ